MKNRYLKELYSLVFLFFSFLLSSCDFEDDDMMNPSSWAAIFIVAAIVLFFYYLFRMFRKRK